MKFKIQVYAVQSFCLIFFVGIIDNEIVLLGVCRANNIHLMLFLCQNITLEKILRIGAAACSNWWFIFEIKQVQKYELIFSKSTPNLFFSFFAIQVKMEISICFCWSCCVNCVLFSDTAWMPSYQRVTSA